MKKPDTRAFFGLQPLKVGNVATEAFHKSGKRKAGGVPSKLSEQEEDGGGQFKPETSSGVDDSSALLVNTWHDDSHETIYGASDAEAADKRWDCPICGRPQPADERRFNDHLDSCLSRRTIRDTVQRDTTESPPLPSDTPTAKRMKSCGEKKRGRPAGLDDPRQKKLSFGGGI
jgi:DNA polymerase kappa